MLKFQLIRVVAVLLTLAMPGFAHAQTASLIPDRVLGKKDAPVIIDEYASLTCSHCAEFSNNVLPEIEKKYIETGKVRMVFHDFPLDGVALKAAALARCMPEDAFYPFIKTLFSTQKTWLASGEIDKTLLQYARLGGLSDDKAQACIKDDKLMDAIVSERTDATQRLKVEATPTFVINGGADTIKGAMPIADFSAAIDRALAAKK